VSSAAFQQPAATDAPIASTVIPPRRWLRPGILVPGAMVAIVLLVIIVVPLLPSYQPYTQNLLNAQLPPFHSGSHALGTDALGRDVLSRLALAGRVSLLIALAVVAITILIGLILGLTAGYFGGPWEAFVMWLADLQLGIPAILLLIASVAALGSSVAILVIVLALTFWVRYGRVARALALTMREREFVLASRTQGAGSLWILRKHLLPEVLSQFVVLGTFDLGLIITVEAALSYLGLGVPPPTPSWGGMISDGQQYLQTNFWLCLIPGVMVFLLVAGVQLLSQQFTSESVLLD
jgi:peptide/nickel transport system permease protein